MFSQNVLRRSGPSCKTHVTLTLEPCGFYLTHPSVIAFER